MARVQTSQWLAMVQARKPAASTNRMRSAGNSQRLRPGDAAGAGAGGGGTGGGGAAAATGAGVSWFMRDPRLRVVAGGGAGCSPCPSAWVDYAGRVGRQQGRGP